MRFGQLKEYNMRSIFLETHTLTFMEKLVPDPFFKKSKLTISVNE